MEDLCPDASEMWPYGRKLGWERVEGEANGASGREGGGERVRAREREERVGSGEGGCRRGGEGEGESERGASGARVDREREWGGRQRVGAGLCKGGGVLRGRVVVDSGGVVDGSEWERDGTVSRRETFLI